ncbi:MAG: hypothetical protein AAF354_14150 [Pseudomonadota bacterium]
MRVSLAPVLAGPQPLIETGAPRHLLDTSGPDIIIGGHLDPSGLAAPIQPRANTLFGPRGACLASPQGPLFVCDTGHHRLLIWKKRPTVELQPADFVIGQPNFESEGRNGREIAFLALLQFINETLKWMGARVGLGPPDYPDFTFEV